MSNDPWQKVHEDFFRDVHYRALESRRYARIEALKNIALLYRCVPQRTLRGIALVYHDTVVLEVTNDFMQEVKDFDEEYFKNVVEHNIAKYHIEKQYQDKEAEKER
jgi:hypothetical protein